MSRYTVDDVLSLSRADVRENYRTFVNPGLAQMLAMLDFDKRFVKAQGVRVWDAEGKEYLDFLGAYGALNLGHNPPEVWQALEQVRTAPNLLQASLGAFAAALGHNLAEAAPGDLSRSFFCNSGAEAVEGGLKLARAATGRKKIVYCNGSFHGKSLGALSVTGREKYQKPFGPLLPETLAVPFGDLDALEGVLRPGDAAAFIVEPIQGEGGVVVPPDGYLKGVRELCSRYGTLMIADEIQTGLGRTGKLFACQDEDVVPDILLLAKSLGGGVIPIGVFMSKPVVWDKAYGGMDRALLHTSTFGGNTLACAAGIAALNSIIEQNLAQRAAELGAYFLEQLQVLREKFPLIQDVRGRGLIIGLEFAKPAGGILDRLTAGKINQISEEYLGSLVAGELINKHQVITAYTLNNPNVIRLEPPLVVSKAEIDVVLNALEEVLKGGGAYTLALKSGRTVLGGLLHRGKP